MADNGTLVIQKKLAVVVSAEMTIKAFLLGHLSALATRFSISAFGNFENPSLLADSGVAGKLSSVKIVRRISPREDFFALLALIGHFRRGRFDAVFSVTPKAGLLSMIAGVIARVPVRIHFFTGQVWVTRRGMMRFLLKSLDRLVALLATDVLADSESQRQFLIAAGVVSSRKSCVLASGSISGVDLQRFRPDQAARERVRQQLGVGEKDVLLLFLGRLNLDKGVMDLADAFREVAVRCPGVHLVYVGPDEGGLRDAVSAVCRDFSARLHFVDFTPAPEKYMAAADVFCLPSYREGFGSVVIEAAAVGVPAIASRIYGLTDAVVEGVTGLLHSPGNVGELVDVLVKMVDSPELRSQYASAAFSRVVDEFSSERLTTALLEYIELRVGRKA